MSGVSRHKFRVPTKGTLEEFFFRLIKGSGQTLWLSAGDQDGWEKRWKSVHGFMIIFPTIYFLGKNVWQLFAKMGHPILHKSNTRILFELLSNNKYNLSEAGFYMIMSFTINHHHRNSAATSLNFNSSTMTTQDSYNNNPSLNSLKHISMCAWTQIF